MSDLMEATLAGVVSGVILQLLARWFSGGKPGELRKVASIGANSHGHVDQSDHSHAEVTVVQEVYQDQRAVASSRGDSTGLDDDSTLLLGGLGVAAACVGFIFSWPAAVGIAAGTAVAVALSALQVWRLTPGTEGPRGQITAIACLSAVIALLGSWWLVVGGPAGRPGMADVEHSVVKEFPTFDDGLSARWSVVVEDPVGVAQAALWPDVLLLTASVILMALVAFLVASDVVRWWSFRNVATGRTAKPGPVGRAYAYAFGGMTGQWVCVVVVSLMFLGCTSGYAAELFEWLANRNTAPAAGN